MEKVVARRRKGPKKFSLKIVTLTPPTLCSCVVYYVVVGNWICQHSVLFSCHTPALVQDIFNLFLDCGDTALENNVPIYPYCGKSCSKKEKRRPKKFFKNCYFNTTNSPCGCSCVVYYVAVGNWICQHSVLFSCHTPSH